MLHSYKHSLALTEVSFSLESKTLWKLQHLYLILNVIMIHWLRECCTWMVVLDRYSFWILRWAKPTAGYCGAFPRTRRTLQARSLDLNRFTTSLHWHGLFPHHDTTDWQPFLCLVFQPYIQGTSHLFKEGLFWWSIGLYTSSPLVFIFLDKMNCWFICHTQSDSYIMRLRL